MDPRMHRHGNAAEMAHVYPPAPLLQAPPAAPTPTPTPNGQVGRPEPHAWVGNDANTLLVVATLITTLTYQMGSNVPGGYWQDTNATAPDGPHRAGDPIMRDLHRPRYWLFMAASWLGFASSMIMTLSLLVRMPVESRHVRWSFTAAYSSLLLSFIASQPKTHLSLDIILWVVVMAFLWVLISFRDERRVRIVNFLCCANRN